MNKTILLLLLFLFLGGASYFYLNKEADQKNTSIDVSDRRFAVKNIEDIQKIFIATRGGRSVTFERKDDYWTIDKDYKVRKTAMENLLEVIEKVDIKHLPAKAALPNIIKDLAANALKIEIYDKSNAIMKSYYVGGVTMDERGTYMIMEGKENPYVMHIPSTSRNLRKVYWMDPIEWRDRSVFSEKFEEIKTVSVEYPDQIDKSFQLNKNGEKYDVKPLFDLNRERALSAVTGRVQGFLVSFESIVAERILKNNNPVRDSVLTTRPFSIIKLEDVKGNKKEVTLFPIKLKDGSIERYYAKVLINDKEYFHLVQHRVLEKILWPYESFFAD